MAAGGAVDLMEQIQSLVSDSLQVVSYKWLSRRFSVASDEAKRMLQNFVEKHGSTLEVVYALSGWLEDDPFTYHIKLVPASKLTVAKKAFKDSCSVQVYSVQACIPKDLAVLWNAEFVQTEELFDQPSSIDNCLRDNRFCAILNSSVKRGTDPKCSFNAAISKSHAGSSMVLKPDGSIQNSSVQPFQEDKPHQTTLNSAVQSFSDMNNDKKCMDPPNKLNLDKNSGTAVPAGKLKVQNDRLQVNGGSLATLWACASNKNNQPRPETESINDALAPTREIKPSISESLDKREEKMDEKCGSGRKRKVVFDFSDDEAENEDIVSLASPELPKRHFVTNCGGDNDSASLKSKNTISDAQNSTKIVMEQEGKEPINITTTKPGDVAVPRSGTMMEKRQGNATESSDEEQIAGIMNPASPKRKKVLKTRIDERGREVTEVVWEDTNVDARITDRTMASSISESRHSAANKPTASATSAPIPVGKMANKKVAAKGGKDVKQGNIMSFFKKI